MHVGGVQCIPSHAPDMLAILAREYHNLELIFCLHACEEQWVSAADSCGGLACARACEAWHGDDGGYAGGTQLTTSYKQGRLWGRRDTAAAAC